MLMDTKRYLNFEACDYGGNSHNSAISNFALLHICSFKQEKIFLCVN